LVDARKRTNGTEDGLFDAPTRQNDTQRVRDASDIVRIVGEHIALKPKGREYVGLCPFHDDHKPSMSVVPQKQIFHCFSCDTGGDVFTFVQKYHRMTFPEALEYLAQRAGVDLAPRRTDSAPTSGVTRRDVVAANEYAQSFFRRMLEREDIGAAARDLIRRRGISAEMADAFGLGASPDRWDGLLQTIDNKGLDRGHFIAAGLLKKRATEGLYDAFRNRLMFPISNQAGQVVAFGARRIDDEDEPKYLNSAESPAFDKSATLYALHQASRAIQRDRLAIVCEGYTDVIACHQAGLTNAVGTLGTALTPAHADLLARLEATVVLLFDGDEAGERAADRAVEVVFARPIDVRIALLSNAGPEKDPDELLKTPDGLERLRAVIDAAPDVLEFRFARLRTRLQGAGPAALERAIQQELTRLLELGLSRVPPVRRRLMLRRLSEITGLPADTIARAIPAGRRARDAGAADSAPRRALDVLEHLLGCVLCDPALWSTLDESGHDLLAPDRFTDTNTRSLASLMSDMARDGLDPGLDAVLGATEVEPVKTAAVALSRRIDEETEHRRDRLHEHWHACLDSIRRQEDRRAIPTDASDGALGRIERLRTLAATGGGDNRVLPRAGQDITAGGA
jgi:DNA primase